ncbi:MAG: SCO family protein, partial [Thermomicrobiales bacterium]
GVLLVSAALLAAGVVGGGQPALIGTDLGRQPAPDFTLTDHRGQTVRLNDFRGKAVVLTFIYTHCPDVCPLIAENLRVAHELLAEESRDDVALLAVTVDPERDTRQALEEFTTVHRLADNPGWFALRGDAATLGQVWRDYGIYPGMRDAASDGRGTPAIGGGDGHTDGIYFIDREGRERVFLRSIATPQEIASNLAALLN